MVFKIIDSCKKKITNSTIDFMNITFNFFLIPFVNLIRVIDSARVFLYVEIFVGFLTWAFIIFFMKNISIDLVPSSSFCLFFFCTFFSWFFFSGAKPNDRMSLSEIKEEIGYSQFKFFRNTFLIVTTTIFFVYQSFC